ncbi:AraC family transcriptional regulator [Paenibacillus chitinolyticus]|uniref:AraC family transcriptional regulator n=1 Tax=Paenibacillus chitinolyticus TaxID=79263 RepID=UPI002DBF38FB|nr:AraC family transcriptional regulator [Paenibacillus chitinolyticus]MEC0249034.1 AraC family transcriptional regulator [Paenibacillus chitinolyticus]
MTGIQDPASAVKDEVHILSAGYSVHRKPFVSNQRDGIQYYLLRLQTEGTCQVWQEGRYVTAEPGDLLLYRPGDAYELRIGSQHETLPPDADTVYSGDYYLMCSGSWMDAWWERFKRPGIIRVGLDDSWLNIWREIFRERRRLHDNLQEIGDYLVRVLCLSLDRVIGDLSDLGSFPQKPRFSYMVQRMKTYIEQNASEAFTLQDLADHVGLSTSRAGHLFRETFGQSVMDYAIEVRISMACERIRFGAMTLEQAAESCGFHSYSYFHRTFRARMGLSPREYRDGKLGSLEKPQEHGVT